MGLTIDADDLHGDDSTEEQDDGRDLEARTGSAARVQDSEGT